MNKNEHPTYKKQQKCQRHQARRVSCHIIDQFVFVLSRRLRGLWLLGVVVLFSVSPGANAQVVSYAYDFSAVNFSDGIFDGTPPPFDAVDGSFGFTFDPELSESPGYEVTPDFVNLVIEEFEYGTENTIVEIIAIEGVGFFVLFGGPEQGAGGTGPNSNDFSLVFRIDTVGAAVPQTASMVVRIESLFDGWSSFGEDVLIVEFSEEPEPIVVPADTCTAETGGCNPTGGHEIVLPEGFVVPPGGTITQTPFPFVDPRVDENGRCTGQTPLVLFDGDLVLPPHICGSPEFEVLVTEANFDILSGTVINTMFPEVFVSNPLDCNRPIIGDPQAQDIVVWQPTNSGDVVEGRAIELTYDCGSSRGRTRGFSFYVVGTHIDFGLDFDQDPGAVTQGFIDLTSGKFDAFITAVRNAEEALSKGEFKRAEALAVNAARLHNNGNFAAASRMLGTLRMLIDRSLFDTSGGFNHEGNIISRLDNIRFTLDEKIIPFAGP